jgi:nucleoside-diphosphate-sugar epimerase
MGRYLVVGASGYVGARLSELLLTQGHYVRGLVRDPDQDIAQRLAGQGMAVWQGDITQPESLVGVASGVEHVFNLTTGFILESGSLRRVFVEGNRNLIAACSRARTLRSYSFISSAAPYGDRGDAWLSEDSPAAPCYPLGHVMAEAEQAIMDLVRRHHFPAMILRSGTIYGPERDVVDTVLSGTATLIGDGRNFISRIHIDDLLTVLDRLALAGQPGAIYNVADDEPMRTAEFYGEVRHRLGMLPPRMFPKDAALFAGMDPSVVGMASSSARLSNRRIKDELGLRLRYPTFRDWLNERLGALIGAPLPADQELVLAG